MDIFMQLSDLLSTSSSSSSSDDEFVVQQLFQQTKRNRVQQFIDVVEKYSEAEFREQFRVQRSTAQIVISKYENSTYFRRRLGGGGRQEIPAKTQIYIFLWFAGNKDSYREVANLFGVSISSTYRIISNVLELIFKISPQYVKFPTSVEENAQISTKFEQIAGFPNVLGCIDGCYIYVRKPANKIRSKYINRHDLLSLTLQGIWDADTRFVDVFVGAPSKIHDARVFQLSFISKELPQICGSQYHLLGDAAYPLREFLMTPFKDTGNMTAKRRKYNKRLSQTRVRIENSFASLKTRFRQIMRLDFHTVERMCKFILACCVLHNMCIDENDSWNIEAAAMPDTTNNAETENVELPDFTLQRLGEIKRNRIADSF